MSTIEDVLAGRAKWCVIEGDALVVLPTVPDSSAALVLADIPYGEVNRESGGLRELDKGNADIQTFPTAWAASESSRVSAGSVYIWCCTEQVSDLRASMVASGLTTRLCVWEKSNPSPMNGEVLWLSGIEACVFGRHPKAWFSEMCKNPVWRGPTECEQEHPTQKPVWLMRRLVNASCPDDGVCVDFCCGSGTTGVACMQSGRRFIGIEIDPGYAAIARRRIAEAANHLFAGGAA